MMGMNFGGMIARASNPMGGIGAAMRRRQPAGGGGMMGGMAQRLKQAAGQIMGAPGQNPNAIQKPQMMGAGGFQQLPQPGPVKVAEPGPGAVPGPEMMGGGQVDPWAEVKKSGGVFNPPQMPQRKPQYGGYNPWGGMMGGGF